MSHLLSKLLNSLYANAYGLERVGGGGYGVYVNEPKEPESTTQKEAAKKGQITLGIQGIQTDIQPDLDAQIANASNKLVLQVKPAEVAPIQHDPQEIMARLYKDRSIPIDFTAAEMDFMMTTKFADEFTRIFTYHLFEKRFDLNICYRELAKTDRFAETLFKNKSIFFLPNQPHYEQIKKDSKLFNLIMSSLKIGIENGTFDFSQYFYKKFDHGPAENGNHDLCQGDYVAFAKMKYFIDDPVIKEMSNYKNTKSANENDLNIIGYEKFLTHQKFQYSGVDDPSYLKILQNKNIEHDFRFAENLSANLTPLLTNKFMSEIEKNHKLNDKIQIEVKDFCEILVTNIIADAIKENINIPAADSKQSISASGGPDEMMNRVNSTAVNSATQLMSKYSGEDILLFVKKFHEAPLPDYLRPLNKLEWQPIMPKPFQASNGLQVVEMTTSYELEVEGKKLQHCIGSGGYASAAVGSGNASGKVHLLSIRNAQGEPTSSIEIHIVPKGSGDAGSVANTDYQIKVMQHYTEYNSPPSAADQAAIKEYLNKLTSGEESLAVSSLQEVRSTLGQKHLPNAPVANFLFNFPPSLKDFILKNIQALPTPQRQAGMVHEINNRWNIPLLVPNDKGELVKPAPIRQVQHQQGGNWFHYDPQSAAWSVKNADGTLGVSLTGNELMNRLAAQGGMAGTGVEADGKNKVGKSYVDLPAYQQTQADGKTSDQPAQRYWYSGDKLNANGSVAGEGHWSVEAPDPKNPGATRLEQVKVADVFMSRISNTRFIESTRVKSILGGEGWSHRPKDCAGAYGNESRVPTYMDDHGLAQKYFTYPEKDYKFTDSRDLATGEPITLSPQQQQVRTHDLVSSGQSAVVYDQIVAARQAAIPSPLKAPPVTPSNSGGGGAFNPNVRLHPTSEAGYVAGPALAPANPPSVAERVAAEQNDALNRYNQEIARNAQQGAATSGTDAIYAGLAGVFEGQLRVSAPSTSSGILHLDIAQTDATGEPLAVRQRIMDAMAQKGVPINPDHITLVGEHTGLNGQRQWRFQLDGSYGSQAAQRGQAAPSAGTTASSTAVTAQVQNLLNATSDGDIYRAVQRGNTLEIYRPDGQALDQARIGKSLGLAFGSDAALTSQRIANNSTDPKAGTTQRISLQITPQMVDATARVLTPPSAEITSLVNEASQVARAQTDLIVADNLAAADQHLAQFNQELQVQYQKDQAAKLAGASGKTPASPAARPVLYEGGGSTALGRDATAVKPASNAGLANKVYVAQVVGGADGGAESKGAPRLGSDLEFAPSFEIKPGLRNSIEEAIWMFNNSPKTFYKVLDNKVMTAGLYTVAGGELASMVAYTLEVNKQTLLGNTQAAKEAGLKAQLSLKALTHLFGAVAVTNFITGSLSRLGTPAGVPAIAGSCAIETGVILIDGLRGTRSAPQLTVHTGAVAVQTAALMGSQLGAVSVVARVCYGAAVKAINTKRGLPPEEIAALQPPPDMFEGFARALMAGESGYQLLGKQVFGGGLTQPVRTPPTQPIVQEERVDAGDGMIRIEQIPKE